MTQNLEEIIVCQLHWDGRFPRVCVSEQTRAGEYLDQALKSANGAISVGTLEDMKGLTIEQLRTQHKGLIVFQEAGSFSTYSDQANAT